MRDGSKTNPHVYPKSPEVIEEADFVYITKVRASLFRTTHGFVLLPK